MEVEWNVFIFSYFIWKIFLRHFVPGFPLLPFQVNITDSTGKLFLFILQNFTVYRVQSLSNLSRNRKSEAAPPPELSLTKAVLKICSKFKGEHPCRSVILLKSHLHMGVLLYICWIMSEQLLMRARLEDCFWKTS